MAQRNIDFGTFPDDPDADAIRTAFSKVQQNFSELYSGLQTQAVLSVNKTPGPGITVNSPTGDVVISAKLACLQVSSTSLNLSNGAVPSSYVIISSSAQALAIDLPSTIDSVSNINLSDTLTAAYLYGDGSNITNLPTGNANYANFAGTAFAVAGANVSGIVASANYATYVDGANVSGIVANANYAAYAGNVTVNAQPNITSLGTLSNLVVTGNVTSASGFFFGDGGLLSNLAIPSGNSISDGTSNVVVAPSANVTVSISGNSDIATFTSDGLLLGNGVGGNLYGARDVWATYLHGDGSNITNLSGLNATKISNGTSNVSVLLSNVTVGISGTSNVVVISPALMEVAGNIVANVNGYAIGYRNIPQILLSANTTANTSAVGKHYYNTTAADYTLTVPNSAVQTFTIGDAFDVVNQSTGNILVAQDVNVTLYQAGNATPDNRIVGPYGMATVMLVSGNTWFIKMFQ